MKQIITALFLTGYLMCQQPLIKKFAPVTSEAVFAPRGPAPADWSPDPINFQIFEGGYPLLYPGEPQPQIWFPQWRAWDGTQSFQAAYWFNRKGWKHYTTSPAIAPGPSYQLPEYAAPPFLAAAYKTADDSHPARIEVTLYADSGTGGAAEKWGCGLVRNGPLDMEVTEVALFVKATGLQYPIQENLIWTQYGYGMATGDPASPYYMPLKPFLSFSLTKDDYVPADQPGLSAGWSKRNVSWFGLPSNATGIKVALQAITFTRGSVTTATYPPGSPSNPVTFLNLAYAGLAVYSSVIFVQIP